ncbi:ABC transporter substrate-binding protein [Brevibacillus reuszeri]|uniref:ABC transporter substrate-binding protein n=1 Tax=Brevibacillus reuszeri TaxID=54915 RepID=A0ABQ0TSQ9_9BACL|nr:ABC transporter substrate-binding protein [Brevibacillus reuszeri]MED1860768.1 ABC transporter substrate-binding protein [Brevibacillus reuszeri]GED70437.1 ABC transporter substrate-binding protein [Brevibacillus reuszeri]
MLHTNNRLKIQTIGFWLLSLCLVFTLIGCGAAPQQATTEPAATQKTNESTAEPASANPDEVILAAPRDLAPGPQDAYYTSTILYVWEPLLTAGEDGEPAPKLAKSWKMSDDGKEWTFTLQENVLFHDGEKLNADAVITNFNRYQQVSPKSSPFYTLDSKKSYPGLKEIVKVDDLSFKLTFEQPQPTLLYSMVSFSSPIYSPKNFDEKGDFNGLPQGTGPFKLAAHEKDQYALLEAFDGYYGEKAKTKKIRVRVIPDPDTRLSALKSGEIMGVMDLGAIPPSLAKELLKDDRFEISTAKSTISHYLHPNGKKPPFDNPKMRKAVSILIDREQLVQELYLGYPTATANLLNVTSPFYKDFPIAHNTEEAKKLATEALGGKREKVDLIVPTYGLNRYPYKAQAEWLQAILAELNLDVEIRILDGAAFKDAQAKGDYNLALATQGLPSADPYTIFTNYIASDGSSNKSYSLGYKSERVDALLEQAKNTLSMDERRKIYDELQAISVEELPTIPLFNDASLIAYNKQIKGYQATIYGTTLPQLEWAK